MTLPEPILVERKGNVALVTLNRPEAMNAINTEMAQSLSRVFSELDSDAETRVIVLTGAGEKAFSAGADLKERIGLSLQGLEAQRRMLVRAFDAVGSARKPVIAAVNGYALGGGFELALLCDFIIAGDHARLGLPEVKRGIIPGGGGTQTLPRLVGKAVAKQMIFTGEPIDAQEAFRLGIVVKVVPGSKVVEEALEIAEVIARNAPLAVIQAKRAIDVGAEIDLQSGRAFELEAYNVCLRSEDREEGIRAFAEGRAPDFKGR